MSSKGDTRECVYWHCCYDESWRGLIVDAAFAHPAKAARGLLRRIFDHMETMGWLRPRRLVCSSCSVVLKYSQQKTLFRTSNYSQVPVLRSQDQNVQTCPHCGGHLKEVEADCVLDCFGGIGTTGIESAHRGFRFIGIELERRFAELAERNFLIHRHVWQASGDPLPVMICGDSRKAAELVSGHLAACVGSPPFGEALSGRGIAVQVGKRSYMPETQGTSPGQLASMPEGNVDAAIGSPPYADGPVNSTSNGIDWEKAGRPDRTKPSDKRGLSYGQTDGQLGAMREGDVAAVVGSPPYAESLQGDGTAKETAKESHAKRSDPKQGGSLGKSQRHQGYGGKENLGNLAEGDVDGVVSSPPWENQEPSHAQGSEKFKAKHRELHPSKCAKDPTFVDSEYGKADGQLGNTTGETFWSAARTILEQVHQLLKPGGVPVPDGEGIDFCDCV